MFTTPRAIPLLEGFFIGGAKPSIGGAKDRVEADFQALLVRMQQRLYPETIPVLASFWLKTVCAKGYRRRDWMKFRHLLKLALDRQIYEGPTREAIVAISDWIEQSVLLKNRAPRARHPRLASAQINWGAERAAAYMVRLLNEWLPVEVARLLINESESACSPNDGIPVLAIGRALDRLLARECASQQTLEMLLDCSQPSPEFIYPADWEVLQDVLMARLVRTAAPTPAITPARLLCVAPNSQLPADYSDALRSAFLVRQPRGEEVHVPIAPAWVRSMIGDKPVRIGSILVTTDGRAWEAQNVQSSEQCTVVYRPIGRLRIDYSEEHARLRVPWPENRLSWPGSCHFSNTFKIFGREWRASGWEVDAERTWLHLVFSRVLSVSEIFPAAENWRLRPASVDMAWNTLGNALASSLVQKSNEPIEQMRDPDLIPLGVAISRLASNAMRRRPGAYAAIESELVALRNLEDPIVSAYGRVPWRILPASVRATFLRFQRYPATLELLHEVFEGLPQERTTPPRYWSRGA